MDNSSTPAVWKPAVLGTDRLDESFSAYLVRAPFGMHADAAELIGTTAFLDKGAAVIRGVLSKMPTARIAEGEMITLLARRV